MELKELVDKTLEMFGARNTQELKEKIFEICKSNDEPMFANFKELVGDLSIDWLQKNIPILRS